MSRPRWLPAAVGGTLGFMSVVTAPLLFLLRDPAEWVEYRSETLGTFLGVYALGAVPGSLGGAVGAARARRLRERRGAAWSDAATGWVGAFAGGAVPAVATVATVAVAAAGRR